MFFCEPKCQYLGTSCRKCILISGLHTSIIDVCVRACVYSYHELRGAVIYTCVSKLYLYLCITIYDPHMCVKTYYLHLCVKIMICTCISKFSLSCMWPHPVLYVTSPCLVRDFTLSCTWSHPVCCLHSAITTSPVKTSSDSGEVPKVQGSSKNNTTSTTSDDKKKVQHSKNVTTTDDTVQSDTHKTAAAVPTIVEKTKEVVIIHEQGVGTTVVHQKAKSDRGAVVALGLGLAVTAILLLFVGCRLRNMKRKLRRGRPMNSNEADYLINGMYLWNGCPSSADCISILIHYTTNAGLFASQCKWLF